MSKVQLDNPDLVRFRHNYTTGYHIFVRTLDSHRRRCFAGTIRRMYGSSQRPMWEAVLPNSEAVPGNTKQVALIPLANVQDVPLWRTRKAALEALLEEYRKARARAARRVKTRKYGGDDRYSWAVFVDGRPVTTGDDQWQAQWQRLREIERLLGANDVHHPEVFNDIG